jgi:hypothetical protein
VIDWWSLARSTRKLTGVHVHVFACVWCGSIRDVFVMLAQGLRMDEQLVTEYMEDAADVDEVKDDVNIASAASPAIC